MVNNTAASKLFVPAAAVLVFSCMVLQAQQAPVYPENTPLYFGNPSRAAADVSDEDNYPMEKNSIRFHTAARVIFPTGLHGICARQISEKQDVLTHSGP